MRQRIQRADVLIEEIRRIDGSAAWERCGRLRELFANDVWRQRRDPNGRPYASAEELAMLEFGYTWKAIRDLFRVCAHFPEEDVRRFGHTKLLYMMRLPSEECATMLRRLRQGEVLSRAQINQTCLSKRHRVHAHDRNGPVEMTDERRRELAGLIRRGTESFLDELEEMIGEQRKCIRLAKRSRLRMVAQ